MKALLSFILLFLMLSCSPKPLSGLYQTDSAGKVLMAGYDYQFFPDSTFTMSYWSDDLSSNRKGKGIYRTIGNRLTLQYEEFLLPEADYEWYRLEEMDDGKTYYQFKVKDTEGQFLGGLIIELLDSKGQPLIQGVTNVDGAFNINITKAEPAQTIALKYLGMESMEIVLTDYMSSGFNITMVPKSNYVEAGTVEEFNCKNTSKYLQLDDGIRKWRVVRQ